MSIQYCGCAGHPRPHMSCAMHGNLGECKLGARCEHQAEKPAFGVGDTVELLVPCGRRTVWSNGYGRVYGVIEGSPLMMALDVNFPGAGMVRISWPVWALRRVG